MPKIDGKQPLRPKHIPERTCIACKAGKNKRELVRIVHTGNGIEIDITGKKSGRGAYLCSSFNCWEQGLKGNHLEHALRTRLSKADRQSLVQYSKTLVKSL
jgi:predicted RNA-binding protein YlxR (DUF448 family)